MTKEICDRCKKETTEVFRMGRYKSTKLFLCHNCYILWHEDCNTNGIHTTHLWDGDNDKFYKFWLSRYNIFIGKLDKEKEVVQFD